MKKISWLALVLVFIGAVSQADQKDETNKVADKQKEGGLSGLISPNVNQLMTHTASDGICPKIGYKKFFGAWIAQYPPTSVDPDCPPK
jgi:hypothetical protein